MQVPVEHKDLAESIQSLVDATVKAASGNAGGGEVDYAATEKLIAEQTAAIERTAPTKIDSAEHLGDAAGESLHTLRYGAIHGRTLDAGASTL